MGIRIKQPSTSGNGVPVVTADNGLTVNTPGNVELGGQLIKTTTVDLNGQLFQIGGVDQGGGISFLGLLGNNAQLASYSPTPNNFVSLVSASGATQSVDIQQTDVVLQRTTELSLLVSSQGLTSGIIDNSSGTKRKQMSYRYLTTEGVVIRDDIAQVGMQEFADYSANYTDRNYITRGWALANLPSLPVTVMFAAQSASRNVFTYLNPLAANKKVFRVNMAIQALTATVAVVTLTLTFTDTSNVVRNLSFLNSSALAAGANYSNTYNIMSRPGTNIQLVFTIVSGTLTYDISASVENMVI
jgi:hypothetical protein